MKFKTNKLAKPVGITLVYLGCIFPVTTSFAANAHVQYGQPGYYTPEQRRLQSQPQQPQRHHQPQQHQTQTRHNQPQEPAQPKRSVEELNAILFRASQLGRTELMQRVLEDGAEATYTNHHGETPLHAAAAYGHMTAAQMLISKGADTNARTVKNWTPLHNAARFGHSRVATYLVHHGAKVNMWNSDGKTPKGLAEIAGFYNTSDALNRFGAR